MPKWKGGLYVHVLYKLFTVFNVKIYKAVKYSRSRKLVCEGFIRELCEYEIRSLNYVFHIVTVKCYIFL